MNHDRTKFKMFSVTGDALLPFEGVYNSQGMAMEDIVEPGEYVILPVTISSSTKANNGKNDLGKDTLQGESNPQGTSGNVVSQRAETGGPRNQARQSRTQTQNAAKAAAKKGAAKK